MTINKLNLPAKANAVQSKINEIIDNFPSGTTVDQTFDGTSANAQSGVAIEGAGFIKNAASGTDCIGILGVTSSASIRSISIGKNSHAVGEGAISICSPRLLNLNWGAYADGAIQIGAGKNTNANTLQVGSYQLLDEYGVIPDERISKQTTLSSSSTDIQIPSAKCVYDNLLLKADTTLSNVSSIDSNSAVQTALDGKVSKSGDTMTGNLNISGDNNVNIRLSNTGIVKGTIPSTQTWQGVHFNDSTNDPDWENTRIGVIESSVDTSGNTHVNVLASPNVMGSSIQDGFKVQMTSSGVASCSFPNTTCVDGQWVAVNWDIKVNYTLAAGATESWTISQLPSDGYIYEVMGSITAKGTGIGVGIRSALVYTTACRAVTLSGQSSTFTIPIGTDHKIGLTNINASNTVTINYYRIFAYRRIGTNS